MKDDAATPESTGPGTRSADRAAENNAAKDSAVEDGAVEDGAVEDGAVEDSATEENATEENAAEDNALEDNAVEQAEPTLRTYRTCPERSHPYSERLYAAWWIWLLPLTGAALLAASIHVGYSTVPVWLPYVVLLPLAVITMLAIGRTRIAVTTTGQEPELHVGQARLPLRFVGSVEIIERDRKQAVLGPEFDPAAFLTHRASVGPVVLLELTDPDDATPYWVFSTRRPTRLVSALGADTEATK